MGGSRCLRYGEYPSYFDLSSAKEKCSEDKSCVGMEYRASFSYPQIRLCLDAIYKRLDSDKYLSRFDQIQLFKKAESPGKGNDQLARYCLIARRFL